MAKDARLLRADEIEVRIGNSNKAKTGFSLMLYKDARCDMNLLDELYGPEMWQREHKEINGTIYCGVSINYGTIEKPYWVTKWDAGSQSDTEAEKGAASDSFKRACVNATGVGRELYTAPFIWMNENPNEAKSKRWFVKEIAYNDNREIIALVICESNTQEEVFRFGATAKPAKKAAPKAQSPSQPQNAPQPAPAQATAQQQPQQQPQTPPVDPIISKKIKAASDFVNGNPIALNYYQEELHIQIKMWKVEQYLFVYNHLVSNKKIEPVK